MFKHDIYVKCNLRSVGVFNIIQTGLNDLHISYQANTHGHFPLSQIIENEILFQNI